MAGVRGASAAEPLHLTYHAFEGCPSASEFFERVRARTPRAELAPPEQRAVRYDVALTPQGDSVHGSLLVVEPGGAQRTRDVDGESCGDVASALAFVVALAVDPTASPTPERVVAAPVTAPLPPPNRPSPAAPPASPLPPAARSPWLVSLHGVAASVTKGSLDALGYGASLERRFAAHDQWAPRVRATVFRAAEAFVSNEGDLIAVAYDVDVTLYALRLEGCPLAFPLFRRLTLSPCVGVDTGLLETQSDAPGVNDTMSAWVAPLGLGRLQWFGPSDRLAFEIQGGAAVPLTRHSFSNESPPALLRTSPSVGGFASVGLGLAF